MKNKLKSLSDFVLTLEEGLKSTADTSMEKWKLTLKYTKFVKQKSNLGMFVPCDENNNFMAHPSKKGFLGSQEMQYDFYKKKYDKAKEKVLFKGFTYNPETNNIENENLIVDLDTGSFIHISQLGYGGGYFGKTIEDLVPLDLELTESAIKQLWK